MAIVAVLAFASRAFRRKPSTPFTRSVVAGVVIYLAVMFALELTAVVVERSSTSALDAPGETRSGPVYAVSAPPPTQRSD